MKKIANKVVSNSIFLMLSSVGATIFSFFYWLAIGKLLLPGDYGIISTTINFAIFLSTISVFGFSFTIIKLIPEYLAKKQHEKISLLTGFALKFMLLSSILISALILLFADVISGFLNIPTTAVSMIGVVLVSLTMATYFDSILRGYQNMKLVTIMQIIGQFSKLALSVILVVLGLGYVGPLFGFVSLYVLISIVGLKFVGVRFSSGTDTKNLLLKYSFPAFLSAILSYVFYSGRYIILNVLKSPLETGIFSLAITMTAPIILFPNVLLQAIFPISSELTANKKYKRSLITTISYFLKYILTITLPAVIFLTIFSKPLILVFSRHEYLESANLFPILAASSVIFAFGSIFYQTLYALGKTGIYRNIMLYSILLFLLSSIPLTYLFSAYGMSFSVLIFSTAYTVLSYMYLRNFIELKIPFISIGKIVMATIISMGLLYLITTFGYGVILGIIATLVGVVAYFVSLLALKFVDKTDVNILNNIVSRAPVLKKYLDPMIKLLYKTL